MVNLTDRDNACCVDGTSTSMPEIEGKRDRFSKRIIANEKRVLRDHRSLIRAIEKREFRRAVVITRKELTFNLED